MSRFCGATLERFGIPARFYFDSELNGHAIIRFLTGVVDALLAGWDYADTLAVLRLAPDVGIGPAMDRIDFAVRMQLPGRGLEFLKAAAATDPALSSLVNAFSELEPWTSRELSPRLWADCAKALCSLVRFRRPDRRLTRSDGEIGRGQSAALNAFEVALDEAVQCFDSEDAIPLSCFWPKVKSVLRLSPLRVHDLRREVVHVIGAHEARQWALPVVFVCGLVEKQFPSLHRPDPFFPDFARCRLRDAGIRVRTAAEFEAEERFLFDAAVTRASILSVLSYPQFDAQGEQNLRSVYLDDLLLPADSPVAVRPQPRRPGPGRSQRSGSAAVTCSSVSPRKPPRSAPPPSRPICNALSAFSDVTHWRSNRRLPGLTSGLMPAYSEASFIAYWQNGTATLRPSSRCSSASFRKHVTSSESRPATQSKRHGTACSKTCKRL